MRSALTLPEDNEFYREPFNSLIITVLSQNTSHENTTRAFSQLSKRFDITPQALAHANVEDIRDAIRSGGL
ncbi:MAG: hypothetical protein ACE5OY_00215 [Candidatus Bathyarchaeia archaeon]